MKQDDEDRLTQAAQRKRRLVEEEEREGDLSFWRGLSMISAIGWTIALPTIGGAVLGWYIEVHFHTTHAWGIPLMLLGLLAGGLAAWREVQKE